MCVFASIRIYSCSWTITNKFELLTILPKWFAPKKLHETCGGHFRFSRCRKAGIGKWHEIEICAVCTISCSCHYWHIFPSLLEVTPILPECFIFSDLLIAEIFILTLIRSCHFQYGSPFSWFNYFLLLLICTSFFFASKKFSLLKLFDQKLPATCKSKWM